MRDVRIDARVVLIRTSPRLIGTAVNLTVDRGAKIAVRGFALRRMSGLLRLVLGVLSRNLVMPRGLGGMPSLSWRTLCHRRTRNQHRHT
ncbi:MAG TPA: hypothetical protein VHY35_03615 [Stellaceae bacterium]|nr:hypothetical protein [Stellaceae bacterium]